MLCLNSYRIRYLDRIFNLFKLAHVVEMAELLSFILHVNHKMFFFFLAKFKFYSELRNSLYICKIFLKNNFNFHLKQSIKNAFQDC